MLRKPLSLALLSALLAASGLLSLSPVLEQTAEAGHRHYDNCRHDRDDRYWDDRRGGRWDRNDRPFFRTRTGKVVQGGLIGGGIGAATGVVLDKPVLKSTIIGAAVGAGVQAVRTSDW